MIRMETAIMTMERKGAVVTKIQLERVESGKSPLILRDPASNDEGKETSTGKAEMKFWMPTVTVVCMAVRCCAMSLIASASERASFMISFELEEELEINSIRSAP
eukprot:1102096_1